MVPWEGATTSSKLARTHHFCHTATSHHAKGMQMVNVERAQVDKVVGGGSNALALFFSFCAGEERESCSRRSLLGLLHRVIRKSLNNKPPHV